MATHVIGLAPGERTTSTNMFMTAEEVMEVENVGIIILSFFHL